MNFKEIDINRVLIAFFGCLVYFDHYFFIPCFCFLIFSLSEKLISKLVKNPYEDLKLEFDKKLKEVDRQIENLNVKVSFKK